MSGAATAAVLAAALLVSLLGGWGFTAVVLRLADREPRSRRPGPTPSGPAARRRRRRTDPTAPARLVARARPATSAARTLRGGLTIGLLERAAVTLAIAAGQPDAVAVVVAVKGLGRFAELKENPSASERFVIGSLASLLWASVVGALTRALLT